MADREVVELGEERASSASSFSGMERSLRGCPAAACLVDHADGRRAEDPRAGPARRTRAAVAQAAPRRPAPARDPRVQRARRRRRRPPSSSATTAGPRPARTRPARGQHVDGTSSCCSSSLTRSPGLHGAARRSTWKDSAGAPNAPSSPSSARRGTPPTALRGPPARTSSSRAHPPPPPPAAAPGVRPDARGRAARRDARHRLRRARRALTRRRSSARPCRGPLEHRERGRRRAAAHRRWAPPGWRGRNYVTLDSSSRTGSGPRRVRLVAPTDASSAPGSAAPPRDAAMAGTARATCSPTAATPATAWPGFDQLPLRGCTGTRSRTRRRSRPATRRSRTWTTSWPPPGSAPR